MIHIDTPFPIGASSWSSLHTGKNGHQTDIGKVALCSLLEATHNEIQVLEVAADSSVKWLDNSIKVDYATSKVMWSNRLFAGQELLGSSGDGISIWRKKEDTFLPEYDCITHLVSKPTSLGGDSHHQKTSSANGALSRNPPAPITSFDWNHFDNNLLVSGSYDTTCSVWNLSSQRETPIGSIKTQLIAHDKEVFDVAWSSGSADCFVSVGGDGSLRLFDIRSLDHSTILYESSDNRPLLRVEWNSLDPNYMATMAQDSGRAIIIDVRMPSVPAAELAMPPALLKNVNGSFKEVTDQVVSIKWSPSVSSQLMTCTQGTCLLWDLDLANPSNLQSPTNPLPTSPSVPNGHGWANSSSSNDANGTKKSNNSLEFLPINYIDTSKIPYIQPDSRIQNLMWSPSNSFVMALAMESSLVIMPL